MNPAADTQLVDILLVEDSPDDVELTREAFKAAGVPNRLQVAEDGVEAMRYLRHEGEYADAALPGLILLDLNLPRMSGHEVLAEVRADAALGAIPIVVLTTSDSDDDIAVSYAMRANCYIRKPVGLEPLCDVVKQIERFWLAVVQLPRAVR